MMPLSKLLFLRKGDNFMSVKRNVVVLLFALFVTSGLYAQQENVQPQMTHSIEVQAAQYFSVGVENASSSLGLAYYFDMNQLHLGSSFQLSNSAIDFTTKAKYFPFEIQARSTHRFGAGALVHLEHYYDTFFATDILLSLCYDLITPKGFSFSFEGAASYNNSVVYGIKGSLSQFSFAFDITLCQKITERLSLYASFASHDEFRYPFFITPNYKLGLSLSVVSNQTLKVETLIRCRDQFTTAPYVDNFYLKLYWKITL